jgi:H+-translocating NAD(P) transhydrogenase subunit beta
MNGWMQLSAMVATALFILSLHWMSDPTTARRGVQAGTLGMAVAVAAALLAPGVSEYLWIVIAMAAGALVGVPLSLVPLTAVPQRTALSHAFGGLAAVPP